MKLSARHAKFSVMFSFAIPAADIAAAGAARITVTSGDGRAGSVCGQYQWAWPIPAEFIIIHPGA